MAHPTFTRRHLFQASVRLAAARPRRGAGQGVPRRRRALYGRLVRGQLPRLARRLRCRARKGRGFALQWSQRGCIYCKELHTAYFADPAIETPIREAFDIVHLDLFGAREVTFLDGAKLSEKALGQRERIRATPTFQFFAEVDGKPKEVVRMPGLLPRPEFSALFRYVAEGAYAKEPFDAWLGKQGKG